MFITSQRPDFITSLHSPQYLPAWRRYVLVQPPRAIKYHVQFVSVLHVLHFAALLRQQSLPPSGGAVLS